MGKTLQIIFSRSSILDIRLGFKYALVNIRFNVLKNISKVENTDLGLHYLMSSGIFISDFNRALKLLLAFIYFISTLFPLGFIT